MRKEFESLELRPVRFGELESVRQYAQTTVDSELAPVEIWKERWEKYPESVWIVTERGSEKPLGVIAYVPISQRALKSLVDGEIEGAQLRQESMESSLKECQAVYLILAASPHLRAKALIMRHMRENLALGETTNANSKPILFRATTPDSARIASKYNGRLLHDTSNGKLFIVPEKE